MNASDKIGIFGGGIEGIALAEYLLKKGHEGITLYDEKETPDDHIPVGLKMVLGAGAFEKAEGVDIIFRSPGVKPEKCESARKKGIKITSTTQYFFENCPCKIIGVTGTKGKGTTSTLIYLILKEAGRDTYLGGNIGESPLNFLDKLTADSVVVMELSSFQLQDVTISPHVAVVLRTTSEHLDYHKDTAEYRAAKSPIVKFQKEDDAVVLNKDYEYWNYYADQTLAQKFFVSMGDLEGDGTHLAGPMIISCLRGKCEMIGNTAKVALLGRHNLENILPAVITARFLEVPIPAIQKVIFSFAGLPHRLEFVRNLNGVKYYEDSFSTTPETSVAGVYAFSAPVILIAGGSEKNSDYSEWAAELQKNPNLKTVILMGVTADRMEKELRGAAGGMAGAAAGTARGEGAAGAVAGAQTAAGNAREFPLNIWRAGSLQEAVAKAAELALTGDNVVLSPAAASFDMFKNYKDRGEKFKAMVNGL
jgi:UDP-N-acetylmuramoylalanine--D-glutamate ligase